MPSDNATHRESMLQQEPPVRKKIVNKKFKNVEKRQMKHSKHKKGSKFKGGLIRKLGDNRKIKKRWILKKLIKLTIS